MIRPMTAQDRPAVVSILQNTGMFTADEIEVAIELIDIYLQQPGQKDYIIDVITEEDGSVMGYATYGPTPLTEGTYDLYWIAVSPLAQNKGYGKQLMHWVENKIMEEKGRLLIIETSSQPRYENTRRFYLNQHYEESVRIADFYKPDDDRIIYVKYFS